MIKGSFLFLGTGGSLGVPLPGCQCDVCLSTSSFDKRMRPSGLFSVNGKKILLDAGPDFRCQALKYCIERLDGVLITHTHYDHVGGFDDVRVYSFKKEPLPCLLSAETFQEISHRYDYLVNKVPCPFTFQLLEGDFGQTSFAGLEFHYASYFQSGMKVTGFKIGDLAYISDIRDYSSQVIEAIRGTKTLILSALRESSSKVHFSLEEAIAFSREVGAEKTCLTHISHELSHKKTSALLPDGIIMAYDGLEIPLCY